MEQLIVVGAGGLGREAFQYAMDQFGRDSAIQVAGFLDDDAAALAGDPFEGRILGDIATFQIQPQHRFVVAVGDPALRQALVEQLAARGARFGRLVHPLAYVAPTASIAEGCILAPFCFVGVGARIEAHVVLNTHASIGHDALLSPYCVLSPLCAVGGRTQLGKAVFMGSRSAVVPQRTVGSGAKIAAGAVVMQDVPENSLAVGNPAKSRVLFAP